jgi:hypothetical protein
VPSNAQAAQASPIASYLVGGTQTGPNAWTLSAAESAAWLNANGQTAYLSPDAGSAPSGNSGTSSGDTGTTVTSASSATSGTSVSAHLRSRSVRSHVVPGAGDYGTECFTQNDSTRYAIVCVAVYSNGSSGFKARAYYYGEDQYGNPANMSEITWDWGALYTCTGVSPLSSRGYTSFPESTWTDYISTPDGSNYVTVTGSSFCLQSEISDPELFFSPSHYFEWPEYLYSNDVAFS